CTQQHHSRNQPTAHQIHELLPPSFGHESRPINTGSHGAQGLTPGPDCAALPPSAQYSRNDRIRVPANRCAPNATWDRRVARFITIRAPPKASPISRPRVTPPAVATRPCHPSTRPTDSISFTSPNPSWEGAIRNRTKKNA